MDLSYELIMEALSKSMEAHKHNHQQNYTTPSSTSFGVVIMAFPGSWEVKDWFSDHLFGQTSVDPTMFPSLRFIGQDKLAMVNAAFLERFHKVFKETQFQKQVQKAVEDNKKILLTGHASGGATASFATLWILEEYTRKQNIQIPIGCVTFGCPLVGDRVLSHALRREGWADRFTHFVSEIDIVPRMMLSPHSSIQEQLPNVLSFYQRKVNSVRDHKHKRFKIINRSNRKRNIDRDVGNDLDESMSVAFFENVVTKADSVASYVAYEAMEKGNDLMEKLTVDFVKVSPYRPFGNYVFWTRNGDRDPETARSQLVVENPNAVLQLLFYFCQLGGEDQSLVDFALDSLHSNISYEVELKIGFRNPVNLNVLNDHLLTPNGTAGDAVRTSNKALSELSAKARICLVAVEEAEKRKKENEKRIDASMKTKTKNTEVLLRKIHEYKEQHARGRMDYYNAFKLQDNPTDVESNISRLELMKIWDEIVEMVIREDLPDGFEVRKEWVDLGTKFRRLVEPLDIANYYRHSKGHGYFGHRPKRYKFTQRWYEHANVAEFELVSESNFLAEVEELKKDVEGPKKKEFDEVKERVLRLEKQVSKWVSEKTLENDVFLEKSTFSEWWRGLPDHYRKTESVLKGHFTEP